MRRPVLPGLCEVRRQRRARAIDFRTAAADNSLDNRREVEMNPVDRIVDIFERRGGGTGKLEPVTPLAHALQAATLADEEGAPPPLVAAALLHDIGHLLERGRADIAALGMDARHEEQGHRFLGDCFGAEVTEPVRLHVQAKRYLCAVEPEYLERLSASSLRSLVLQGGPLSRGEVAEFEQHPRAREAVWLRRLDDRAHVRGRPTPTLEDYRGLLQASACVTR